MFIKANVKELPCMEYRKSFYGKAKIYEYENGTKELRSYGTPVCELTADNQFVQYYESNTMTTKRHISSFKIYYGIKN